MNSLYSTGYAYDAEDAENVTFAVRAATRELGAELQRRGVMTDVLDCFGLPDARQAGEIAVKTLFLDRRHLADYRLADIGLWAGNYRALLVAQPAIEPERPTIAARANQERLVELFGAKRASAAGRRHG